VAADATGFLRVFAYPIRSIVRRHDEALAARSSLCEGSRRAGQRPPRIFCWISELRAPLPLPSANLCVTNPHLLSCLLDKVYEFRPK
jgi:hypothetical protein